MVERKPREELKVSFQVRLSQAALDEIDLLVKTKKYSTRSDFMQRAGYDLLSKHGFKEQEEIIDAAVHDRIEALLEDASFLKRLKDRLKDIE